MRANIFTNTFIRVSRAEIVVSKLLLNACARVRDIGTHEGIRGTKNSGELVPPIFEGREKAHYYFLLLGTPLDT